MTLRDWATNGWLKVHTPARQDIAALLTAAENRSIAALMFTLGAGSEELINFLDHCRTMRHDATYEGVRRISRGEADELIEAVRELRERFGEWIRQAHPELM